jgi:tetratricopeptide (TPR) repeat protein
VGNRQPDTGNSSAAAREALNLALSNPRRAQTLAERTAVTAERARDWLTLSISRQAQGLALRCLEQPQESVLALERSVRAAHRGGHRVQAARAQLSLALSLGYAGRNRHALRVLDRAEAALEGGERARARVQRSVVLCWLGRPRAAALGLPSALDDLLRVGDRLWQARALSTLGVARVELGELAAAEVALEAAEELFIALDQRADAAGNRHNRGWCAALLGDIPTALTHYGIAEQRFDALGLPVAEMRLDRARLLLAAGLAHEARAATESALEDLSRKNAVGARAEALLVLSEIALQLGDTAAAQARAGEAAQALRRQKRAGRTAVARYTQLYAAWTAGEGGRSLHRAAGRLAVVLERDGLHATAGDARMLAGRAALDSGDRATARRELEQLARRRRTGPARQRSQAWLAEALLRMDTGDRRGALRALHAGLRVLESHRASLGALELRARTAAHIEEVTELGRGLALRSGRTEQLLRWTEYGRAIALRLPPVRPPADPRLSADLTELRRNSGTARIRLQRQIERRTRQLPGVPAVLPAPPRAAQLAAALGPRALVSYVVVGDQLYAVTLVAGRLRRWSLGPVGPVLRELTFVLAAHRRSVRSGRSGALGSSDAVALRDAADRLDQLLLRPLRPVLDTAQLVVIPPSRLNGVPWSLLPSAAAMPITVAPSATGWYDAVQRPAPRGRAVLVAGPALAHARAEVAELATVYDGAVVLTGDAAVVTAVCTALDGAAMAHLAAHSDVNADNPLFSALRLADGPLMTYDLGQLGAVPALVVLSACDSLAGAGYGDDFLSMATALLHLGARTVIGSLVPLPDALARPVMCALHHRLAAGDPPAAALQHARESVGEDTGAGLATAGALICLGVG